MQQVSIILSTNVHGSFLISVCQLFQDVIWDDISIIDHLYLFGRLRGVRGAALKEDVDKMIESLGFPEKAHSAAGTLSGGQKRRLCVGISMVGGNSVVYLDEPTAGLDPGMYMFV